MGRKTDKDREKVLERDGCRCQMPSCKTKIKNISQLVVHHIDHDQANETMGNKVLLCRQCHLQKTKDFAYANRRMARLYKQLKTYGTEQLLLFE